MNIRKWVSFFFTTLLIGGIAGLVIGLFTDTNMLFSHGLSGTIIAIIQLLSIGMLYSVWSQMFFYAYLTIHRFGLGMFNSVSLWNKVQVVIILFVFFDLVFFRYQASTITGKSLLYYFIFPILLMVISLPIAYIKQKETNQTAFIPTIFFMFVVSSIELVPAFKAGSTPSLLRMAVPLLVSNGYQVLRLHRLISKKN